MKKLNIYRSDFLFPESNFLIGVGSLGNVRGNYYDFNFSESAEDADYKAILSDWGTIGLDLLAAANGYVKINKR